MAERCLGMDNPSTIQEYVTLSHYCFATVQVPASLKLLYRARYLLKLINGEDHPEMATIDQNIGLVLFFSGHWDKLSSLEVSHFKKEKYFSFSNSVGPPSWNHVIPKFEKRETK